MAFLLLVYCLFAVFVLAQSHNWPAKNKVLHIGGIFPINGTEGWQGGMVGVLFVSISLCYYCMYVSVTFLGLSTISNDGLGRC